MNTQEKIVVIREHLEKMIECAHEDPCGSMCFSEKDNFYLFDGANMGIDFYMAMKGIKDALELSLEVWCEVVAMDTQTRPLD